MGDTNNGPPYHIHRGLWGGWHSEAIKVIRPMLETLSTGDGIESISPTRTGRETTRTRIKLSTWEQPCPADRQPQDQEIEQDNEIDTVGKSIEPSSIGLPNRSDGLLGINEC